MKAELVAVLGPGLICTTTAGLSDSVNAAITFAFRQVHDTFTRLKIPYPDSRMTENYYQKMTFLVAYCEDTEAVIATAIVANHGDNDRYCNAHYLGTIKACEDVDVITVIVDKFVQVYGEEHKLMFASGMSTNLRPIFDKRGFVRLFAHKISDHDDPDSEEIFYVRAVGGGPLDVIRERYLYAQVEDRRDLTELLDKHHGNIDWVATCALRSCGKYTRRLCEGCRLTGYCCREHLTQDWKNHKKRCKLLRSS